MEKFVGKNTKDKIRQKFRPSSVRQSGVLLEIMFDGDIFWVLEIIELFMKEMHKLVKLQCCFVDDVHFFNK